ncbi:MAG: type II toxin-antitoxin system HicB family antitoxin [Candidatus Kapabacteria bacterium]|jgi:predicted RNase H-like HicB family nuclease|nr:type II toxin-antitoxin system HicB family antitoxin [Candidatus Kapabacteria bacterium]
MKLPIILEDGEDGWIVATCPSLPGCVSQGRTRDEALVNIREAVELILETADELGWDKPLQLLEVTTIDVELGVAA